MIYFVFSINLSGFRRCLLIFLATSLICVTFSLAGCGGTLANLHAFRVSKAVETSSRSGPQFEGYGDSNTNSRTNHRGDRDKFRLILTDDSARASACDVKGVLITIEYVEDDQSISRRFELPDTAEQIVDQYQCYLMGIKPEDEILEIVSKKAETEKALMEIPIRELGNQRKLTLEESRAIADSLNERAIETKKIRGLR